MQQGGHAWTDYWLALAMFYSQPKYSLLKGLEIDDEYPQQGWAFIRRWA